MAELRRVLTLPIATLAVMGDGCGDGATGRDPVGGEGGIALSIGSDDADASGDDAIGDADEEHFDLGAQPQGPSGGGCSSGEGGEVQFTHIWIANTNQGTVSKIDTRSGVELGRYATSPNAPEGSPSRTSVNQFGDAVVVDRGPGGITKIGATEASCVDKDGDGAIRTSTGPDDVLPWGTDECVLWRTPIPSSDIKHGPRPVAWEGALPDPEGGCDPNVRVWVAYLDDQLDAVAWRLDGSDGSVLDEVKIPWGVSQPYGGAVDAEGDFWMIKENDTRAVEIDHETLTWQTYDPEVNFYGVAMDEDGDLWGGGDDASAAHFHVATGTWSVVATPAVGRIRGLMVDRQRHVWGAGNDPCALVEIDGNTDTLIDDAIALPGCDDPVGVSIDVDGFVWVVDRGVDRAYKVDPSTHAIVLTVEDLDGPYTYSDMTGAGLQLVINPPG